MKHLPIILLAVSVTVLAAVLLFGAGSSDVATAGPGDGCPKTPQHNRCDRATSEATHTIVLTNPPLGPVTCGPGDLSGPTRVSRTEDNDAIQTEIVHMNLTGVCSGIPLTMRESPTLDSTGTITEIVPNINGTLDFPADSFFDVFIEIDTPIGTLHNAVPVEMECQITSLPPYGCEYQIQNAPVPLLNQADQVVGSLTEATHTLVASVGGTTELFVGGAAAPSQASDSDGGNAVLIAALAAGVIVVLAAGGWYARRRWTG